MIRSFEDERAARLFDDQPVPEYQAFERPARRKLYQLDAAQSLNDLRIPPGNHLEALHNDRKGQRSIRVNERYSVCFR